MSMSAPSPMSDDIIQQTVEYPNSAIAQAQMAKEAARGLRVVSTTSVAQSSGIMRWLFLGWLALIFKPKPHILVIYAGRATQLLAAQEAATASVALALQQEQAVQPEHMAHMTPLQQLLHTPLGAGVGLAIYAVAAFAAFYWNWPYALFALAIALAVIDWQSYHTLHGRLAWATWKRQGQNWRYFGFGALCWMMALIFFTPIYFIQAWPLASREHPVSQVNPEK